MATAVVTVSLSLLKAENKPNYGIVFDATNEYVMGSEENTVVIVLDTFGRDILEEELSEHPEALDVLHDFTFYDEEDSVYAPTFPSFVHFLTEYEYNGEPREEYEKTAFTSESSKKFFDEIYSRGYNVEINTRDILTGEYMQYIADNVKSVKKEVNKKEVRRELSKLSAYRYVPYFLKPYFYVMNPGVYTTAYDVKTPQVFNQSHYDNMINGGMQLSDTVKKRVGIYHYYGMHKSYMNDEFAHATEPDTTTRWQTMQGLWVVVDTFFNLMKENGIYDNSTIIVMSDHGVCYDHTGYDHFYTDSIFFMKKPEEKHDEVVRNHAPLTHHEFQRIILESLK
ncbi:MAG: hypothetical protein Q4D29_11665 [Lachnospiraceae bacterium]|nr:hypothetical protein [Lachnospiraceae bacterium]